MGYGQFGFANILYRINTYLENQDDTSKYLRYYYNGSPFVSQGYGFGIEKVIIKDWKLSGCIELMYYKNDPRIKYVSVPDGFRLEYGVQVPHQ